MNERYDPLETLTWIDASIIGAFVAYAVSSGLRSRKVASQNLEEYFLAGRSLSGWKAGISMAATQFSADTPLLVTGLVATAGIFALWQLWIYALAFLLMGFVLAPSWRRAQVLTDAELTELRYGSRAATTLRAIKAIYFGTIFNCVVLAWVLFATTAIAHYTVGQWIWSGRVSFDEVNTPLSWAVVAAIAVLGLDLPVPSWVLRSSDVLGGLAIPLMQLSLGVSLARLRPSDVPRTLALSVGRLAMGVSVGLALAELFGLEGTARGVLILDCAMPAAVFNYMMAERYGRSPSEVASVVVLSTLLSFATLPLLIGWLLGTP